MNVYLFKIDREKVGSYSSGEAIVAANSPSEAWHTLEKELPEYDLQFFSEEKREQIHSLMSQIDEPRVITYCCYVE